MKKIGEYKFKVVDPSEIDIQRICDENPEAPIILVITKDQAALLISKELLGRFEQMRRDAKHTLLTETISVKPSYSQISAACTFADLVVLGDTLDSDWGASSLKIDDDGLCENYTRSKSLQHHRVLVFIKEHIPQALKELGSACAKLGTKRKVEKHTIEVKAFSIDGGK